MAKFLNKKEQVIDFQLTPYGKRTLALGTFKPVYYSFFDEGIIYDGKYASLDNEKQNEIHERIKDDTTFLEGILSFVELENTVPPSMTLDWTSNLVDLINFRESAGRAGYSEARADALFYFYQERVMASDKAFSAFEIISSDVSPDKLTFQSEIGDAHFNSQNQQAAPAWKIVTCQGDIASSTTKDETIYAPRSEYSTGSLDIPQIDVELYYTKRVGKPITDIASTNVANTINTSKAFSDGNVIELIRNDMVVYAEEVNTEMLTDNFEIEVFQMTESSIDDVGFSPSDQTVLTRKYFEKEDPQVVDGFMKRPRPQKALNSATTTLTQNSVEYYFDVLSDSQVYSKLACQCAEVFNKESYYIDLDFKCEEEPEALFYDIYGSVTVPEICDPSNPDFPTEGDPSTDPTDDISCEDE
tara:strand:+ start:1453 stop:2694 length:1242 start_codon:yes stop_codon:yes gene_type:complete